MIGKKLRKFRGRVVLAVHFNIRGCPISFLRQCTRSLHPSLLHDDHTAVYRNPLDSTPNLGGPVPRRVSCPPRLLTSAIVTRQRLVARGPAEIAQSEGNQEP